MQFMHYYSEKRKIERVQVCIAIYFVYSGSLSSGVLEAPTYLIKRSSVLLNWYLLLHTFPFICKGHYSLESSNFCLTRPAQMLIAGSVIFCGCDSYIDRFSSFFSVLCQMFAHTCNPLNSVIKDPECWKIAVLRARCWVHPGYLGDKLTALLYCWKE